MKRIAAIAAALAEDNGRTVNVRYSTSELLTPDGSARIQADIRAAARQVCVESGLRGTDRMKMESACRASTEHAALSDLTIRVAEARAASRTALAAVN